MRRDQSYDCLAKLLIIGDSGVGKTNILLRFCENNYTESHLSTIGIDFKIKTIEIDGKRIRLQIWDTAGQERFKTITQTYYKGAMGILMVYSITDRDSFNALENWIKQVKMHASQNVIKVLIANKSDCEQKRNVSFEEGKKMADYFGIPFFEVSAKSNLNIIDTFHYMANQIKQKVLKNEQESKKDKPHGQKIRDAKKRQNVKSTCC